MTGYSIKIADYTILFTGMTRGISLQPSPSQQSFITGDTDYDLAVNVFTGPVVIRDGATEVFSAPWMEEVNGRMIKRSD